MAKFNELSGLFPLTSPIRTAVTHPELVPSENLPVEHELARNPNSLPRWLQYLSSVHESVQAAERDARGTADPVDEAMLGKRLSTSAGREGLLRLTDIYERALANFPGSFKLWKAYVNMRDAYVLGDPDKAEKLNLARPKRKRKEGEEERGMLDWLKEGLADEADRDIDGGWKEGLDGYVGREEWRSLAAVHERFVMWHPKVGRVSLCIMPLARETGCADLL
jgi:pre-mRNA-splicing factor SYF1